MIMPYNHTSVPISSLSYKTNHTEKLSQPLSSHHAYHALNNINQIEAIFGTKDMGPFARDILRHNPHWLHYDYTMPIESKEAGGRCKIITKHSETRPHANGLVTASSKHLIIGYGADCPGILASTPDGSVIGMFHASWWAQADHGIAKFVKAFAHFGIKPEDIQATIGPCIAANHYTVKADDHFCKTLQQKNPAMLDFLDNEKSCFDVRASTAYLLAEQGVTAVKHIALDTYSHKNKNDDHVFYSARRGRPANHNNPWVISTKPQ
jgi:copper oxidase (laccase) domain-containing protein